MKEAEKNKLLKELGSIVRFNEIMAIHSSIKIGGKVGAFIEPTSEKELRKCLKVLRVFGYKYRVVGACSNILFANELSNLCVISTLRLNNIRVDIKSQTIECGAGARISMCYKTAMNAGLSGFEPLQGIPGSIGGAIIMNAGAFGTEIKDIIQSVRILCPSGRVKELSAKDLKLTYRNSILKGSDSILLSAVFKLKVLAPSVIRSMAADFASRRAELQPVGLSLGSVFKKHGGVSAGEIIDRAGLKGACVGGCKISQKHANFILNSDNGSVRDYKKLVDLAWRTVKKQFKIELEKEIEYIE